MRPRLAFVLVLVGACHKPDATTTADAAPAPSVVHVDKPCPTTDVVTVPVPPLPVDAGEPEAKPTELYTRQVKTVRVGDVDETWILRWRGKPKRSCADNGWSSCPCGMFAFGEEGRLELARLRPGEREEVFVFRDHMAEDPALERWLVPKDFSIDRGPTERELAKLEVFDAMQMGDYDHDGFATEFVFAMNSGGAGCGHYAKFRVVGISKKNPRLHFFALELPHRDHWKEVKNLAPPGEVKLIDYPCGDHGGDVEESLIVSIDAKGNIKSQPKKRACKPGE